MKLRDIKEAPIGDYATIGNWGDKDSRNSFNHDADRRLITKPSLIDKVRRKFGNTEHMLNFYFVNLPGAKKLQETGIMSPSDLAEQMPKAWKMIQQREQEQGTDPSEAINVIYVGNAGTDRVPMTAWIMAHRLGHACARERGFGDRGSSWVDYENEAAGAFQRLVRDVYGWKIETKRGYGLGRGKSMWEDPLTGKFFEQIGTMASARNGRLGRPYEFLYEMMAQYITTGGIKFNPLPQYFGNRNGHLRIQDEEVAEMYNRDLNNYIAGDLESRIDNVMYSATGKYLVM